MLLTLGYINIIKICNILRIKHLNLIYVIIDFYKKDNSRFY